MGWLSFALSAFAQPRFVPQPEYGGIGKPDQAEGRKVLEAFRAKGIAGDYFLEFELHLLPRRGDERIFPGQLWGTRNEQGPLTRMDIATGAAEKDSLNLLVQNGPASQAWRREPAGGAGTISLGTGDLFEPIGATNLTAFDLQMPFLYWPDSTYEGMVRLRGRPTNRFFMPAPAEFSLQFAQKHGGNLAGVRIYLDTQFDALVQAELVDSGGQVLKTISLLELKRVGEQWIPKSFDVRDEMTRDKTRFVVTGAALGLKLPRKIFTPADLGQPVAPPAANLITPVE